MGQQQRVCLPSPSSSALCSGSFFSPRPSPSRRLRLLSLSPSSFLPLPFAVSLAPSAKTVLALSQARWRRSQHRISVFKPRHAYTRATSLAGVGDTSRLVLDAACRSDPAWSGHAGDVGRRVSRIEGCRAGAVTERVGLWLMTGDFFAGDGVRMGVGEDVVRDATCNGRTEKAGHSRRLPICACKAHVVGWE
ncbi:hypothetical protein AB1N83_003453 [Pleurotus pulmonarius]